MILILSVLYANLYFDCVLYFYPSILTGNVFLKNCFQLKIQTWIFWYVFCSHKYTFVVNILVLFGTDDKLPFSLSLFGMIIELLFFSGHFVDVKLTKYVNPKIPPFCWSYRKILLYRLNASWRKCFDLFSRFDILNDFTRISFYKN